MRSAEFAVLKESATFWASNQSLLCERFPSSSRGPTAQKASLVSVPINGGAGAPEGVLPPIILRLPPLAQAFWNAVAAIDGDDVIASFEVSSTLYRTKRGARTGTETVVPAVRRRGVDESLYDRMIRDPDNARDIAFAHSVPMAAQMIGPQLFALATVDATQEPRGFTGIYYVTLMDFAKNAVCPDLAVPGATDATASYIHRFRIDRTRCNWQPLAPSKKVGG